MCTLRMSESERKAQILLFGKFSLPASVPHRVKALCALPCSTVSGSLSRCVSWSSQPPQGPTPAADSFHAQSRCDPGSLAQLTPLPASAWFGPQRGAGSSEHNTAPHPAWPRGAPTPFWVVGSGEEPMPHTAVWTVWPPGVGAPFDAWPQAPLLCSVLEICPSPRMVCLTWGVISLRTEFLGHSFPVFYF